MREKNVPAKAERRLHRRIPDNGSGVAVLYPNYVFSINVLDISAGGLSFTYKGWEDWSNRELMLDYVTGDNFVTKVPCEIVSDLPMERGTALRRCGVRFKSLSPAQTASIEQLLNYNEKTCPPYPSRKDMADHNAMAS